MKFIGIVHDYCECHRPRIFNDDNYCQVTYVFLCFLSFYRRKKKKKKTQTKKKKQKDKRNRKINTQKNYIGPFSDYVL